MRCLAFVVALLLLPAVASAQEEEKASPERDGIGRLQFFSGSVGAGFGGGYEDGAVGWSAKATLGTPRYIFSVRFAQVGEAQIIDFAEPNRQVSEIALLAGWRQRFADGWLMARAQAGPGLVFEQRRGARLPSDCDPRQLICLDANYERKVGRALGIAGEAELLLTPFRYTGLGLRFGGNVNGARSFGGLSVALHLGRLY